MSDPRKINDLPFDQYLSIPRVSASALKALARSPLHYRHYMTSDHESTSAMALGSAAHCDILEPWKFNDRYIRWEGGTRRGKEWEAFKANHADKGILSEDEWDTVAGMSKAVRGFEPARRYLQNGAAEQTILWTEPETGMAIKCRLDWVMHLDVQAVIVDLKTTRDATPRAFGNAAFRLGYHIQFALYADAWFYLTGATPKFVVLAVESKAPYEPAVFAVPDEILAVGHDEYIRLLKQLQECEQSNNWPPRFEREQELALPSFAYSTEDDDLSDVLDLTA